MITSGGVSVGEEDHVKRQVESLGRLDLWKLAIKPGKPLAFGGIGGIAPDRKSDLARLGLRAVLGGTLATMMTATIAGVLTTIA